MGSLLALAPHFLALPLHSLRLSQPQGKVELRTAGSGTWDCRALTAVLAGRHSSPTVLPSHILSAHSTSGSIALGMQP